MQSFVEFNTFLNAANKKIVEAMTPERLKEQKHKQIKTQIEYFKFKLLRNKRDMEVHEKDRDTARYRKIDDYYTFS